MSTLQQSQKPPACRPVLAETSVDALRDALRSATSELMDRGLNVSAKWTAELLSSLKKKESVEADDDDEFETSTPVKRKKNEVNIESNASRASTSKRTAANDAGEASMDTEDAMQELRDRGRRLDGRESADYTLALAYYRVHEHARAAFVLKDCSGPRARWLRCYCKFLAGERRAHEDNGDLLGPKDTTSKNAFSSEILEDMASWPKEDLESDGYLLYLKALVLLSLAPQTPVPKPNDLQPPREGVPPILRAQAMDCLIQSIKIEPWNWSAWLKLASCIEGPEELEAVMKHLPNVLPSVFFYLHATLEVHSAGDELHDILRELEQFFPTASFLDGLRGLIHYHVREFDEALEFFDELHKKDPYRLEDLDTYSNILYVSEKRAELAQLAQEFIKTDRNRPEVCCLVGNYYSIRREHEKAISFFRRALLADRGYLSAWTLMGHEYVEIKNTNAAIASYRRAIDVNRKDYRAWYGLGQTYELLGEPYFALNYYQKAAALRPYDARMWTALGVCYEKLRRIPDTIRCYQRALMCSEIGDSDHAVRIGRLYSSIGDSTRAAQYHKRALYEGIKTDAPKRTLSKIRLWLARHEIARERRKEGEGELDAAEEYLRAAMDDAESKEDAQALLNQVQMLLLDRK